MLKNLNISAYGFVKHISSETPIEYYLDQD